MKFLKSVHSGFSNVNSKPLLIIMVVFIFINPTVVSALSTTDLVTQIQSLLKIVEQLQTRLANLNATLTPTPQSGVGVSTTKPLFCSSLSSTRFGIGHRSPQIVQLQQFLKSTGDFTYPEFTQYYGSVTKAAVQRYQCREMGICSGSPSSNGYGLAGPGTRRGVCEAGTDTNGRQGEVQRSQSTSLTLTRHLHLGLRGKDVQELQEYLTATGDYTYGEITGYYGQATQQAVQRYQGRNGIVSSGTPETTGYGVIGPKTIARLRTEIRNKVPPVTTPVVVPPPITTPVIQPRGSGGGGHPVLPRSKCIVSSSPLITGDTTEAGGVSSFKLVLNVEPTHDVSITLMSSDVTEGIVSPESIILTKDNWDTPQNILITGVDDTEADGDIAYSIVIGETVSTDSHCNNLSVSDVTVVNLDDEAVNTLPIAGLIYGPITRNGMSNGFTVKVGDNEDLATSLQYAIDWDWHLGNSVPTYVNTMGSSIPLNHTFNYATNFLDTVVKLFVKDSEDAVSTSLTTFRLPPKSPKFSVVGSIYRMNMFFGKYDYHVGPVTGMHSEVTPWALSANASGTYFLVSSKDTYMCRVDSGVNILDGEFVSTSTEIKIRDTNTCRQRQGPLVTSSITDVSSIALEPWWKRDYNGVMSGHLVNLAAYGGILRHKLITINHNEHKNNYGGYLPANTVRTSPLEEVGVSTPCLLSFDIGYKADAEAQDCTRLQSGSFQASYNASISMSSMDWTLANTGDESTTQFTEDGPIVWPSNGYIEPKVGSPGEFMKASDGGVREPSSIIHNGYMYVYFRDTSSGSESEGRGPGIKVARAQITANGVDPTSFDVYFNGSWSSALPLGFDAGNYKDFFNKKGGQSSRLISDEPSTWYAQIPETGRDMVPLPGGDAVHPARTREWRPIMSFSVAKVVGQDKFLGVYLKLVVNRDAVSGGVFLTESDDLIHWSKGALVPGTEINPGDNLLRVQKLLYPRFLRSDGKDNNTVDANGFYIIGTQNVVNGNQGGVDRYATIVNAVKLILVSP